MAKVKYEYLYHTTKKLLYRIRIYPNDRYSYKVIDAKYKNQKYEYSNNLYSSLKSKETVVFGKLKTLRLLYEK